ncbi:outer membrane protein assembly factor BamE domain-containing protein [Pseudorhodoferax sp.]|uniref:outer membrane protein assembly factor BamE domain-containing protein n=1 Tax=Pseudorhodoferax sp. TaxID=1993553 RepID=UPI002DD6AE42|nr:outer membrane protein assembly factor BamE [Pseudorhodoferax sp.]
MLRLLAATLFLLLAGCASVQTGMTREQVLAAWGQPTRSVALRDGQRLQYSQQPSGQQVVMVDLDAGGKVRDVRQVMARSEFQRIATDGSWTRADVEREFGPAPDNERVSSWNGPILTYRWREGMIDLYYWVYLDPAGVVRRAHEGLDWRNMRHTIN